MTDWNYDMDAAPRDKPIMVAASGFNAGMGVVEWDAYWNGGWWMCDDGKQAVELPLRGPAPTAWMPIPSPPKGQIDEQ